MRSPRGALAPGGAGAYSRAMTTVNARRGLATAADIARLEEKIDNCASKADLYRALWIQTGAIAGTIIAAAALIVAAVGAP